jgi:L-aspartate oxidase
MKTDILIVGSGCAGLYCALNLPADKEILIITKADIESSDSFLAQGGICMMRDDADYEGYYEDTMRAGHYENDPASVEVMIRSSQEIIGDLIDVGVDFHREEDGSLSFTREGAHSRNRILFHEDITGKEITSKLLAAVKKLPNVRIVEYCTMLDLLCQDNRCYGAVVRNLSGDPAHALDGELEVITANYTVLACGGIGGLYRHSTNFRQLTGDGVAVALKHGVAVKNVNYVQIHPTTLYSERPEDRSFLISESVRGEGAYLYNAAHERFVNELLPRDLLTEEIRKQMKADGTAHVWEDMSVIDESELTGHFPNIVEHCKNKGYDVFSECIPVVPAQHYFMGGVKVDLYSKTSMEQLYAIGETACNGVHGRNRLASNSLLESLVFAKRAAGQMKEQFAQTQIRDISRTELDLSGYEDGKALAKSYRELVLEEIDRENAIGTQL